MALPSPLPYFQGPSDVGSLRDYLNTVVKLINGLLAYFSGGAALNLKRVLVTANYQVQSTDGVVEVDASGGAVTITYPPTLSSTGAAQIVRVVKVDTSGNLVSISDGVNTVAQLVSGANGAIMQYCDVWGDPTGASLRVTGGV